MLLSLALASPGSAVTMAWTFVGDPGNAADSATVMNDRTTGYGSVPYAYDIGTYEVTNAQYVEFLNAKAASDPYFLYSSGGFGGIARSGSPGSYTYSTLPGRADMPVNYVTAFDAMRFANWMNNGKGNADTETGTYTLLGEGGPYPSNMQTVSRNPGATIALASENEWYKAAYYDSATQSYFNYPTASNESPFCTGPSALPNHANCYSSASPHNVVGVGSYTGSASPYGTFDQGGNVWEWNESISTDNNAFQRGVRGGAFNNSIGSLYAGWRGFEYPIDDGTLGFRLVMIPEPSTGLLIIAGLLALGSRNRADV
jgi:formylglycine-generating enzyme